MALRFLILLLLLSAGIVQANDDQFVIGVGDTIVIAATKYIGWRWDGSAVSYGGSEDEVRTIAAINSNLVTLIVFNFRFSTETNAEQLQARTEAVLAKYKLDYDLKWNLSGLPFLTAAGDLVDAAVSAIRTVTGRETELSTAGGTSDGRFIAPTGAQVLELGPVNATIHQVNECVAAADLDLLSEMYQQIMSHLLAK